MATETQNYTLGRGRVSFARFNEGTQTPGAFRYIGNTPEFNMSFESEDLDHYSSDGGIREKDCSIVLEVNRTGSMTTDNIHRENLALFVFGTASDLVTAAVVGLTETLGSVVYGDAYKLGLSSTAPAGLMGLDNLVVMDATDTTTYVVDLDYTVDLVMGLITIVEGGSIALGDEVHLTYDTRASTRDRIVSGSSAVEGAMLYEARNPAGKQVHYYLPYVKVTPNGDFALKSDEWQSIPFTLEILKLEGIEAIYADGEPAFT